MSKKITFLLLFLFTFVSGPAAPQSIAHAFGALASKDENRAVKIFEALAEQGNSSAQGYLAVAYLTGAMGLQKNERIGLKFLRNAAEGGNLIGQAYLGAAFAAGELGLKQDYTEARRLLEASLKAPRTELDDVNRNAKNIAETILAKLPSSAAPLVNQNSVMSKSERETSSISLPMLAQTAEPETRTPEDRYQGTFTFARLSCFLSNKLAKSVAQLREKNIPVKAETLEMADISLCQKKQIEAMGIAYKKFLVLQKSKDAKNALKEHYVAAILAVKGTSSYIGETEADHNQRASEDLRKANEKWVKFEIVK